MEENPPYLFLPALDGARAQVAVTADVDGAVIDITVRGDWDPQLGATVALEIGRCLAESPAAIVIDVAGVADPSAASMPVWLSATQAATAADPPARLALCLPADSPLARRLGQVGAHRYLPVFGSAPEARESLVGSRALTDVVRLRLPPSAVSPAVARNLVGGACQAWNLGAALHPGRAVLSELVSNAVEHARTEMEVSLSRRGTALHLAVRDRDPTLPRIIKPRPVRPDLPLNERGHGLRVVHADSVAWGAIPTAGGKIVWATIRERPTRSRHR
ncbi:ATP-binding protein [Actinoplanes sp. NPDC049599]|uniref:ATP-binding protein n=1 Tax=Actinoplanes sp. NPDC049599 TaxID=3363903 RepID=UPI00379E1608